MRLSLPSLRRALPLLLAAVAPSLAQDTTLVVLASTRDGRIEMFDANLSPLGAIGVNRALESVTPSPDGRTLYLAQESARTHECCDLYSLDVETHQMCSRVPGALFAALTPDGGLLMTQDIRGVNVWNASPEFQLLPATMKASGNYNLQPSPDGHWLFAIANAPHSSLDIFDLQRKDRVRRLPIPEGPATGVWAGGHFYVFSYSHPGEGRLREVRPDDTEIHSAQLVRLPDFHGACNEPLPLMLAGAKDRILLAEVFGHQVDRRGACPDGTPGGIYAIDPSSAAVSLFAPSVHVNRMVVAPDGKTVFVIDAGSSAGRNDVRLARLGSGRHRDFTLASGDWNLSVAQMPYGSIARGFSRAYTGCPR